ncbi:hypothetical protein [Methylorubrum extorquens]|uniref:Uncharacterized protein n=1 Tax=Methylorubrum extorquens DSM 13060 TaxID=882800 RepID=H1KCR1_METEX|nr:hypothetical protein [Methylorubrum extorquens]EHP94734.1 hypothetical protein MetexDRAFT_0423 [Methylorubrum extorquens DSM 13060]
MPSNVRSQTASAFLVSTATFEDFMPDETIINAGIEGRPFTVVSRWNGPGKSADPALIAVTGEGTMRYFAADSSVDTLDWFDDIVPIPDLSGATVTRIVGLGSPRGLNDITVLISALSSANEPFIVAMRKNEREGWSRVPVPDGYLTSIDQAAQFVNSGSVGLAALPSGPVIIHSCQIGSPPVAFISTKEGIASFAVEASYMASTHYIALPDGALGMLQTVGDVLELTQLEMPRADHDSPTVRSYPTGEPSQQRLPFGELSTASQLIPLADPEGVCRGIIVWTPDGSMAYLPIIGSQLQSSQLLLAPSDRPGMLGEVVASLDQAGTAYVFARDTVARIWQMQWNINTPLQEVVWQATGYRGRGLDAPEIVPGTPSLVYQSLSGHSQHISRTISGDWVGRQVAVSSANAAPERAMVHAIQISTVTVQAVPVGEVPVELYADRRCVVEHEGRLIRLDPIIPATLRSNQLGALRLKIRATSLEAPVLTVHFIGKEDSAVRFRPQDGALRRLAGLDPHFPVNGESMKLAGLIPANIDPENASRIADTVRRAASTAYFENGGQPLHHQRERLFQQDRRRILASQGDSGSVGFEVQRIGGAAVIGDAVVQDRARSVQDVIAASSGSWSDFWGYVTGAWENVEKVVVSAIQDVADAAHSIVQISVQIGSEIKNFIANTARRIGEGLEAVLGWLKSLGDQIKDKATEVCAWLAEKLNWEEVINAKTVVRSMAIQALIDIERVVSAAVPAAISREMGWLQTQVSSTMDNAVARLQGISSLSSYAANSSAHATLQSEGVKILAIQHSIPSHVPSRELFQPSDLLLSKFDILNKSIQSYSTNGNLRAAIDRVGVLLSGEVSLQDGVNALLSGLILEMKDLVILAIQAADVIQTAVFQLVGDLIALVREIITTPVARANKDLAWINGLYKHLSGGADLDMLDLAALFFVAPGVILHGLISTKKLVPDSSAPQITMYGILADQVTTTASERAIDHPAVKYFHEHEPWIRLCQSVFFVVRSRLSPIEDGIRYITCRVDTAVPKVPTNIFMQIMSIAGMILGVLQHSQLIAQYMIYYGSSLPPQYLLIIVLFVLFVIVVNLGWVVSYFVPQPRGVMYYPLGFLTAIYSLLCYYFPGTALLNYDPSQFSDDERINFYLTITSSFFSCTQGIVQFGVYYAGAVPDPTSSAAVFVGSMAASQFCYLAAGVLSMTASIRRLNL